MAQTALLFFALSLATYWMLVRKKKRESAEWVPAALVRAYLDRVRADERDTRIKLFGEYSASLTTAPTMAAFSGGTVMQQPQQVVMNVSDPALAKELEALRVQLTMADQRAIEFDRMVNGLKAEKTALEQRLTQAQAAAAAGVTAGAPDPAMQKELQDLRAKLQEYEVIEDDLANLKKFQKENEQLRQQLAAGGGNVAAALTVVPGGAAAPVANTVISGVTEKINTPVTVISGGAPASTGPANMVVSGSSTATTPNSGEANTNVLAPITPIVDTGAPAPVVAAAPAPAPVAPAPAAAPAAAPEKSAKQKEEELLSEFEKMLAS